jgi:hypothetical protein
MLAGDDQLRCCKPGLGAQPVGRGTGQCGGLLRQQRAVPLARLAAQVVGVGSGGEC